MSPLSRPPGGASRHPRPPWLPRQLLRRLLRSQDQEFILGDIDEEYSRSIRPTQSAWRAYGWYWHQAVASILSVQRSRLLRIERAPSRPTRHPQSSGDPIMNSLGSDFRYALRTLRRQPGFAAAALLTLSLGIGANTAIFSVVYSVLLSPLPYPQAERIVMIWQTDQPTGRTHTVSSPNFWDWKERSRAFSGMYAFDWAQKTIRIGEQRHRVIVGQVSAGFHTVTGVEPLLGRGFEPGDEGPSAAPVALLGYGYWQSRFGADPGAVGATVELNGEAFQIIGVMPPGFVAPLGGIEQMWLPMRRNMLEEARDTYNLMVAARLADALTLDQARQEMELLWSAIREENPETTIDRGIALLDLREEMVGEVREPLLVLLGAVTLLLLMACANVANLLLARISGRQSEIALRTALGASRGRILRQVLCESVVLALAAALLGIGLAAAGIETLVALAPPDLPRLDQIAMNWQVLAFALGLAMVSGLAFGALPAWHSARKDPALGINQGSRTSIGSRSQGWTRSLLVASQLAIALMLLIGAGLLMQSFVRLLNVDPGFDTRNVLTAGVLLPSDAYPDGQSQALLYERLLQRLEALPGVESAGGVWGAPMSSTRVTYALRLEGRPEPDPGQAPGAEFRFATGGYFQALSIPLLQGRTFQPSDSIEAPQVVMVSRLLAEEFWPAENPIGKRLALQPDSPDDPLKWRTVVGVVGDVRLTGLDDVERGVLYLPYSQSPQNFMVVTLRTSLPPAQLAEPFRQAIFEVEPRIPSPRIDSMQSRLAETLSQRRFSLLLLLVFAGLALVLASMGVYGVLSYMVSMRKGEIGLRMALGAGRMRILRFVTRQGMAMSLLGIAFGLVGALALSRTLSSLVYGVAVTDPATFAAVTLLLALIALAACSLPALRASRIDPVHTLKG